MTYDNGWRKVFGKYCAWTQDTPMSPEEARIKCGNDDKCKAYQVYSYPEQNGKPHVAKLCGTRLHKWNVDGKNFGNFGSGTDKWYTVFVKGKYIGHIHTPMHGKTVQYYKIR